MQQAKIIGFVYEDSEMALIGSDQYVKFSVAVVAGSGDNKIYTWYKCLSRNKTLNEKIKKGTKLFVEGNLSAKIYQTKSNESALDLTIYPHTVQILNTQNYSQNERN